MAHYLVAKRCISGQYPCSRAHLETTAAKIVDDVSAGPSLNMTVKSANNILFRSVKTCPTSQKSTEALLNNHSINWPELYMIPQKVTIETSFRVFQYELLYNIVYLNKRASKFDRAVNPLCSLCSQAPEGVR